MACGLPVVSTDGGALPEVVGEAASLVPVGNPSALADAIEELLNNPALRESLARAGAKRIRTHFTWQRAAQQMGDLYQQIINGDRS